MSVHMLSEPPTTRYSWRNFHPQAKLYYIRNAEQANAQIELLRGPVGFDLEWRPNTRKGEPENPVSLVQLANNETILLIQISAMKEFPNKLQEFLESPNFVKAGIEIQKDAQKLYKDHQVTMRNCVDLSSLARSVDHARWKGNDSSSLGLARLVAVYENLLLPKGMITRSDWEAKLSPEQQEYAANDAHSGYILYKRLSPDYDPAPPPPPKIAKPPRAISVPITLLAAIVAILIIVYARNA